MAGSPTLIARAAESREHVLPAAAKAHQRTGSPYASWLLAAAVLSNSFQVFWFSRACIHNIDFDGMDYVGIARHVSDGNFHASINAFRSPLISWLIAFLTPHGEHLVTVGKLVTFASFIAVEVLLYVFTLRLWRSRLAAAIAVLWFSLARGILPLALLFVSPDYLFAALTLLYFTVLETCIRKPCKRTWFYLGCVHGAAYLAKAFALPWLALTTIIAAALARNAHARQKLSYVGLAAMAPIIAVAGWGSVLHAKYDVFTTGSQFKTNMMQWTLHADLSPHNKGYEALVDTSQTTDAYMVTDPMPPHSSAWSLHFTSRQMIGPILRTEFRNVPRAVKEIVVVVTPGGCLLVCLGLLAFRRWGERHRHQLVIITIVAFSSVALVGAYCMLVFDARYALPINTLLMATSAGLLFWEQSPISRELRVLGGALIVAGLLFTFFYKASPFRTLTRDFQTSCVDAGNKLREHPHATVITIGEGPFPEHGIGWEAGYKAAFFGGARVVASAQRISGENLGKLERDIQKSSADVLMLWGNPRTGSYQQLISDLAAQYPSGRWRPVNDPERGQVGSILSIK